MEAKMKWLKSTTQKTWVASGKTIPACVTPHNDYLQIDDSEYAVLTAIPVIKSLINAGGILVLDQEPAELKNSVDNLQLSNVALKARNAELETQIAQLQKQATPIVDVEAIKAEAQEEIKAEAIKELQEKQESLDAAQAEIKKLKAQLEKAKAKSKQENEE